jgi:hypothetical protein
MDSMEEEGGRELAEMEIAVTSTLAAEAEGLSTEGVSGSESSCSIMMTKEDEEDTLEAPIPPLQILDGVFIVSFVHALLRR